MNTCGDCTMCCKLLGVTELNKPPGIWCSVCTPGVGCNEYNTRPKSCREFRCLWLDTLPEELKPNLSKVVLVPSTDDGQAIVAFVDPTSPRALAEGSNMRTYLKKLVNTGTIVMVSMSGDLKEIWYSGTKSPKELVKHLKETF